MAMLKPKLKMSRPAPIRPTQEFDGLMKNAEAKNARLRKSEFDMDRQLDRRREDGMS